MVNSLGAVSLPVLIYTHAPWVCIVRVDTLTESAVQASVQASKTNRLDRHRLIIARLALLKSSSFMMGVISLLR